MSQENIGANEPRYEFGGPCPRIGAWFFPHDPSKKPTQIDDNIEVQGESQDDAPQPA